MPSHAPGQNDADENVNIALKRANINGSKHSYSSQWMDHWMRSRSNSTSQIRKDFTVPGTGNSSEFREAKMLSIEVMRSKITEYQDVWCSEPGKKYIHSDIHSEKGIVDDKKIYGLRNNEDASADWKNFGACHFPSSENTNFKCNHFPMFDINRKIECILSSKKKSKCDTMAIKMTESQFWNSESVLASHAAKFASDEHRFQIWSMAESTDHGSSSCKSAEDSPSNQVDHSGPVFNYHRLNTAAPIYITKQVSPLNSKPPCDIVNKETSRTFLDHGQYNSCKRSAFPPFLPSELKDNSQMLGRSTSQFKNKTVQLRTTCYRDGISFPIIIHERDKEILSDSKKISPSHDCEPGLRKFSDFRSPNQHKMKQKTGIDLSGGGKIIQETTNSAASKETGFIEAIPLSAMSQSRERRTASLKLLENSISGEDKDESGTNPNTVKNQLESSVKTKRIHSDASQSPACTPGVNSSRPQKKTSSLIKEAIVRNAESDLPQVKQHLKDSEIRESSTSKTESVGEDHILCHVEKIDNLESTHQPVESLFCLESSNQWIKRLSHDPSEYFSHGTKRLKLAGTLGNGNGCTTLYDGVLNCNGSRADLPSSSKEQKESDKAIVLKEKGECSSKEHTKTVNSWIRRWCHSSQQTTTTPQVTQTVPVHIKLGGTKIMPKRTEVKQLPSLAAMALMGKAVTSFRPCEFQRRGSSVVWNTEEP